MPKAAGLPPMKAGVTSGFVRTAGVTGILARRLAPRTAQAEQGFSGIPVKQRPDRSKEICAPAGHPGRLRHRYFPATGIRCGSEIGFRKVTRSDVDWSEGGVQTVTSKSSGWMIPSATRVTLPVMRIE